MAAGVETVAVEAMPEWLQDVVDGIAAKVPGSGRVKVRRVLGSSNELVELGFGEDRILMLKRGRRDWVQGMFDTAETASELLRGATDLTVPRPIQVESGSSDPLQAYWRIQLPTLGGLWPELSVPERHDALRSLGALIRRLHRVELPGWGSLLRLETGDSGLERYLRRDLSERLLPAVHGSWSEGTAPLERLIDTVPVVAGRVDGAGGSLSHGDVHLQNVLCRVTETGVRCVGLLDLDSCRSLPPEADLASFDALHGPLFNQQLDESRHDALREGYGAPLDPILLRFFGAAHLANLGFHSAIVGDDIHAGWVADALAEEVGALLADLAGGPHRGPQR